ncbi:hypothetical protein Tsubulata_012556 [Turnera subulata]|uniref:DUF3615 domain-containing protein n=1 Tax=Turnera subulata TaxID=218843 RepID=A0A9Q0JLR4_9ROSI|nr:hypothetical protein Tsubulata_012556 [Turnera subulata]
MEHHEGNSSGEEMRGSSYGVGVPNFHPHPFECPSYLDTADLSIAHYNREKGSNFIVVEDVEGMEVKGNSIMEDNLDPETDKWHHVNFYASQQGDEEPKLFYGAVKYKGSEFFHHETETVECYKHNLPAV